MTLQLAGPHWTPHTSHVNTLHVGAPHWLIVCGLFDNPLYKDVFYRRFGMGFIFLKFGSEKAPIYPTNVLREWFGEMADVVKTSKLNYLVLETKEKEIQLTFSVVEGDDVKRDTRFFVEVDPAYDATLHEEDMLQDYETLVLPLDQAYPGDSEYHFRIPRVLVRDFVFSIFRMGDATLHANRDQVDEAVEDFLKK